MSLFGIRVLHCRAGLVLYLFAASNAATRCPYDANYYLTNIIVQSCLFLWAWMHYFNLCSFTVDNKCRYMMWMFRMFLLPKESFFILKTFFTLKDIHDTTHLLTESFNSYIPAYTAIWCLMCIIAALQQCGLCASWCPAEATFPLPATTACNFQQHKVSVTDFGMVDGNCFDSSLAEHIKQTVFPGGF